MTTKNTSLTASINKGSLLKAILIGAGLGFFIILLFVTGAETQPHWPNLWQIRPLIITPLAGAIGGGLCYATIKILKRAGLHSVLAIFLSLIGFFITLWMGIVLGLDGTLWD